MSWRNSSFEFRIAPCPWGNCNIVLDEDDVIMGACGGGPLDRETVDRQWSDRYAADKRRWETDLAAVRAELLDIRSGPTATRHADGRVTVEWPDGATACLVRRELLDEMLAERDRLRGLLGEALEGWADTGTWAEVDPQVRREDIARIRREAGLS